MMSLRGRKQITDAWGNYLFTIREKIMSWRTTYLGEDQNGTVLFELRNRMSCESNWRVLGLCWCLCVTSKQLPNSVTRVHC